MHILSGRIINFPVPRQNPCAWPELLLYARLSCSSVWSTCSWCGCSAGWRSAAAGIADLAAVPEGPGVRHPGMRLHARGHRAAPAPSCLVRDGGPDPRRPYRGRHRSSDRSRAPRTTRRNTASRARSCGEDSRAEPRSGGRPGVAGYQDAIHHRVTTIDPGGCAPVRSEPSVDVIPQISICRRARQ